MALRSPLPSGSSAGLAPVLLALLLLVAGCTTTSTTTTVSAAADPTPAPRANVSTPSGETDAQRRARLRLELAASYFDQGKTAVALDEVRQALAADPNHAEAYNLRGLIFMRLGDNGQAEESFRRALSIDAGDSDTQHNYGWLLCQQRRYDEAERLFAQAAANPLYAGRAKTQMAQGLCQARAGRTAEAEQTLARAYERDPANPIVAYNLAAMAFRRGDMEHARFYIRRLNNGDYANAESLWRGIRIERRLGDRVAMEQLADQLRKRFPDARELLAYERGAFDE
ncbi:type IV pilus biogenesis/stability protein PilW [Xylophilus sp.]|uniref:type IV pilus biogenesis/stability protein PilW n=1 Tax=Xylophilus sp. TaxID=2653893 RepID=UPI0013BC83EE|nr:type IV pilus biogenesis/stability protein PilW [Xylophilus sp.]KAF1046525.1 MAG: Lipopolysaccharide assembly protein B [Xylophilus sp.]